jgi:hypothetical protein
MLFASCSNTPTDVKDPQKETTVQLQQLAAIDTINYKVVEIDDVVYILKDELVVKKIENQSGECGSAGIVIMIMFIIGLIIGFLLGRD